MPLFPLLVGKSEEFVSNRPALFVPTMDLLTLNRVDGQLGSSEVAALCFLCRDVLTPRDLEKVQDGKDLFIQLQEKDLLNNSNFLSKLLHTIKRADLLELVEKDGPQTDASPMLSEYRVMLYEIHEDITEKNLKTIKFLLGGKLGRGKIDLCTTALDVFVLMEKTGLLSKNELNLLQDILEKCDVQLVRKLQECMKGVSQQPCVVPSHISMDNQRVLNPPEAQPPCFSIPEIIPHVDETLLDAPKEPHLCSDAEASEGSSSSSHNQDFYTLVNRPRGTCLVINNEHFYGDNLKNRPGTQEDEKSLCDVFGKLGFRMEVRMDLTADGIRKALAELGKRNYVKADVLVVCVLSHGEVECVLGTDGGKVPLKDLTRPFNSKHAPTLAGKPKLFFIQACQGNNFQRGAIPCLPRPQEGEGALGACLEEDAGPLPAELVPWDADYLMGMATVGDCKSFRNTVTGSIYIQELCRQLLVSAKSNDDILTTLTRVNREVSRGVFQNHKQMPEPKYTLTKKLVLSVVSAAVH